MPHIIVKLHPGRTEEQKQELTAALTREMMAIAKCPETSVSVAIEEVPQEDWAEKVYKPDILEKQQILYKKPGYKNPFE